MLNTNTIPRAQRQLMVAAEKFTYDKIIYHNVDKDEHYDSNNDNIDVNLWSLNLRWMLASRWEN